MINNIFGYVFANPKLLEEALTHPSTNLKSKINNQRLEFLGDSVLNFVITNILYSLYPKDNEGYLAKKRSYLVGSEILARIAIDHSLNLYLIVSHSEEKLGGKNNKHNLEDALEAVVAAIYLDGGIEIVTEIIKKLWQPHLLKMKDVPIDDKSKVQEIIQKKGLGLPHYKLLDIKGKDHEPEFSVELIIPNFKSVIGFGSSKRNAEKDAAKKFLKIYESN